MLRQLPKLSLPSFMKSSQSEIEPMGESANVKIYDLITASTPLNAEGNTMQLQLFHMDSQVNEGQRELHGNLILNTESLPD